MIANRLQVEAAISTAPNTARDVPYDSTLMIHPKNLIFVSFVNSLLSSSNGLKWCLFSVQRVMNFRANMVHLIHTLAMVQTTGSTMQHQPDDSCTSRALSRPFPRTSFTTRLSRVLNSFLNIFPNLVAFSASFSSSRTFKHKTRTAHQ